MKQTIEIDVPEGYEVVRYGKPSKGELFLDFGVKVAEFDYGQSSYPILRDVKTYTFGDVFELNGGHNGLVILAQVDVRVAHFIRLADGNRWSYPVKVVHPLKITKSEIEQLANCSEAKHVGRLQVSDDGKSVSLITN